MVALFAEEVAQREFLKPSEVVRSFMQRGMLQYQTERARQLREIQEGAR
jgi:hypothetical protein